MINSNLTLIHLWRLKKGSANFIFIDYMNRDVTISISLKIFKLLVIQYKLGIDTISRTHLPEIHKLLSNNPPNKKIVFYLYNDINTAVLTRENFPGYDYPKHRPTLNFHQFQRFFWFRQL